MRKMKRKGIRFLGLLLAVLLCVIPMSLSAPADPSGSVAAHETLPTVGTRQKLVELLDSMGVFSAYDDMLRTKDGLLATNDAAPTPAPEAEAGSAAVAQDTGFTGTNTQVTGVDEGDIVKTDGAYIYVASSSTRKISIIKADGKNMKKLGEFTLAENHYFSGEMYVWDHYLVVVSGWTEASAAVPAPYDKPVTADVAIWRPSRSFTRYTVIDISDREHPVVFRTFDVSGYSLSTRLADGNLYFAVNQGLYYGLARDAGDDILLPTTYDSATGANAVSVQPEKIYYIPGSGEASYLMVGALDITRQDPCDLQTYLGAGSTLYMNRDTMVIARPNWSAEKVVTEFYRFAIDGVKIAYTAKASAPGTLSTQYAMDVFDGYFRAATTAWQEGSYVTVFDQAMRQVGQTPALAPEESIQAVRFMGDTGYVVTYRQVDPLFVLDLSDPAKPTVLGELKVPGFSSYLHPVGPGLLVGLGRHTMETFVKHDDGREELVGMTDMGMKISLFDVGDPRQPKELDTLLLGRGSHAEAAYNPRALMADASRALIGFDVQVYGFEPLSGTPNVDNWEGGLIVRVADGRRLEIAGELKLDTDQGKYYGWQRRLCAIGDTLYQVEETRLTAYDYQSFAKLDSLVFGELRD